MQELLSLILNFFNNFLRRVLYAYAVCWRVLWWYVIHLLCITCRII